MLLLDSMSVVTQPGSRLGPSPQPGQESVLPARGSINSKIWLCLLPSVNDPSSIPLMLCHPWCTNGQYGLKSNRLAKGVQQHSRAAPLSALAPLPRSVETARVQIHAAGKGPTFN